MAEKKKDIMSNVTDAYSNMLKDRMQRSSDKVEAPRSEYMDDRYSNNPSLKEWTKDNQKLNELDEYMKKRKQGSNDEG